MPAAATTVETIGATPESGADAGSPERAPAGGTVATTTAADPWPAYFAAVRDAVERAKYYPFSARLAGLEDRVAVDFFIATDGAAEQIRLIEPSRFPVLNDAAVETIRRVARFPAPPLRDNQSASGGGVRVTVPLEFTLHTHKETQPE
jgi:protein TonB